MSLSCSCSEWDGDGWTFWLAGEDPGPLRTKRPRKCCSCGVNIHPQQMCLTFERCRGPKNDIEERIYGDYSEPCVPLANYYMCELCGEIYLNLSALEFCLDPTENMRDNLEDYHELTGFTKIEGKFGRKSHRGPDPAARGGAPAARG